MLQFFHDREGHVADPGGAHGIHDLGHAFPFGVRLGRNGHHNRSRVGSALGLRLLGQPGEIPLQFVKTFLLGILYTLWFVLGLFDGTGSPISNFSTSMAWAIGPGALAAWGALVYSAVGPGALADVLQQQGQRTVPPSQANVLLSLEPVFAALCARLLLGEVTTLNENIGGSLIVLAALVTTVTASFSDKSPNESVKE